MVTMIVDAKRRSEAFSSFPASSLPGFRFDRRFVRKILIEKHFSMQNEPRKNFYPGLPCVAGKARGGPTLPSLVPLAAAASDSGVALSFLSRPQRCRAIVGVPLGSRITIRKRAISRSMTGADRNRRGDRYADRRRSGPFLVAGHAVRAVTGSAGSCPAENLTL
jgi:hypothetical protein